MLTQWNWFKCQGLLRRGARKTASTCLQVFPTIRVARRMCVGDPPEFLSWLKQFYCCVNEIMLTLWLWADCGWRTHLAGSRYSCERIYNFRWRHLCGEIQLHNHIYIYILIHVKISEQQTKYQSGMSALLGDPPQVTRSHSLSRHMPKIIVHIDNYIISAADGYVCYLGSASSPN